MHNSIECEAKAQHNASKRRRLDADRIQTRSRPDGSIFRGAASNYICDLKLGDTAQVVGPFGATFLMPDDAETDIVMICTSTAPFRAFAERRRRLASAGRGRL